jgi:hypothetical protein
MAEKICTVCKELKPLESFYNRKASADGKAYRCKSCDSLTTLGSRKRRYLKHREQSRRNNRLCKYGLTETSFDNMLESQEGKCACCGKVLSEEFGRYHKPNKLVVDHCHENNYVRGLLCTMCNKGIGLLGDNSEGLLKAFQYLKDVEDKHKQNAEVH